MENKYIGMIVLAAVGIIFALALIPQIASNQAQLTNRVTVYNESLTAGQFNFSGSAYVLKGHDASSVVVNNVTTPFAVVGAGNYTVTARVLQSDGNVRSTIQPTNGAEYDVTAVKVSYTYSPDSYIDDSAGRSVAGLIVLFTVIGLVCFAVWGSNIKEAIADFGA